MLRPVISHIADAQLKEFKLKKYLKHRISQIKYNPIPHHVWPTDHRISSRLISLIKVNNLYSNTHRRILLTYLHEYKLHFTECQVFAYSYVSELQAV